MRDVTSSAPEAEYDALSRFAARRATLGNRRAWAPAVVACLAAVLVVAVVVVPSNLMAAPVPIRVGSIGVGILFFIAGVLGVSHRPQSPIGPLLLVVGALYLVGRLQGADPPVVGLAANLANSTWQGIIFYITFSFPQGRLRSPGAIVLVVGGLGFTLVNNLFVLVTAPTRAAPGVDPDNPWFLGLPPGTIDVVRPVLLYTGYLLIVGGAAWLTRRWLDASPPLRRVLTPVYVSALFTSLTAVGLRVTLGVVSPSTDPTQVVSIALLVAYGLLPVGFLIGLLRAHSARAAVADLVVELGELPSPQRLQVALADALRDPTLQVITWSGERNAFVNSHGGIAQPPSPSAARAVTVLNRRGEPSAVLVHDPAVLHDPGLVAAVGTAVRLTLDIEELEMQVGRQIGEVRASRARVVAAADEAREKIERDIHDGTQQQLLGVAIGLQGLRRHMNGDAQAVRELDEVRDQLNAALAELRQLAQGVHPAVLTQHGLAPALRALSRRSSIPVQLDVDDGDQRPPAPTEAALYFIASSALHNAQAHSSASRIDIHLRVLSDAVRLTIRDDGVGGAAEGQGSGLTGMRDRAETAGGTVEIDSPRGGPTEIRAVIPTAALDALR